MLETCADTSVSWHNYAKEATITLAERNALVEQYLPLVRSVVGSIAARGIPTYIELDDLIQDASLRLVDTVQQYQGRRGACMVTFLRRSIRNDVLDMIRVERKRRDGTHEYSLAQLRPDKRRINMREAKRFLTERQWDALLYTYGLGFTQVEAGRILGCDQATISRLVSSAYEKVS